MTDYRAEVERRTEQFRRFLEPMDHRAHEVAYGSCFMVFENHPPDGDPGLQRREKREPVLAAVAEVLGERCGPQPGELRPPDLPDKGWREEDSPIRFVQFSFEKDWFCMDLPRDVLSFGEAMEVLWYRTGFFYLRDKPKFALRGEPEGHDPFRKVYAYGDEESAAEDAAFLFFRAWELPVDSRLYVSSAAFSGEHEWERGVALG